MDVGRVTLDSQVVSWIAGPVGAIIVLLLVLTAVLRGYLYPRSTIEAMKAQMADLLLQRDAMTAAAKSANDAFAQALDLIEKMGNVRARAR